MGTKIERPIKETGIIFQSWGVLAIQKNLKTQTRRMRGLKEINKEPDNYTGPFFNNVTGLWEFLYVPESSVLEAKCPYGKVGDRLWVREPWRVNAIGYVCKEHNDRNTVEVEYATLPGHARGDREWYCVTNEELTKANHYYDKHNNGCFSPNIHMPKWACRIWLEITGMKVERVQDITQLGLKAEGVPANLKTGKGSTVFGNPWVWVLKFRRIDNGIRPRT